MPLALYALAGFVLVPHLVERRLPGYVAERLGQDLAIGEVAFNPFLLRFEADALALAKPGAPLVAVEHLVADLEWSSLWRRVWVFESVRLRGADARLVRLPGGGFNFTPQPAGTAGRADGPPPLRVERLVVEAGRLTFVDLTGAAPARITLAPLALEANALTTLAAPPGDYRLDVGLPGGASLSLHGQVAPAAATADGRLRVADLPIAALWPFVRERWKLDAPEGRLDLSAAVRFAGAPATPRLVVDAVDARLSGLVLSRRARIEPPLLSLRSARAEGGRLELRPRESPVATLALPRLELAEGRLRLEVDRAGRLNWGTLGTAEGEAGAAWRAALPAVRVRGVAIDYIDRQARPAFRAAGALAADGRVHLEGAAGQTRVAIDGVAASLGCVELSPLGAKAAARLSAVTLSGGRLDSAARRYGAQSLAARGGELPLVRDAAGHLALAGFRLGSNKPAPAGEPEDAAGWRYTLARASLSDVAVAFVDRGDAAPLSYRARASAKLTNIDRGARAPIGFDGSLRWPDRGRLRLRGDVAQDASRASAQLDLRNFALPPLQPVLARYAALDLVSGRLGGSATLRYAAAARPQWRAAGRVEVEDLHVNEAASDERFVSARTLAARGTLSLEPNRVLIEELAVREPGAKLVVSAGRKFNLAQVLKRPPGERAAGMDATRAEAVDDWEASIERVVVSGGTVDFADYSLVLPFSARVESVSATALGIASRPDAIAVLEAEGSIDPYGSARVSGRLKPSAPTDFTDLKVEFDNVRVPPLSPYTATFAGRIVASGDLWLDLHYRFVDGQMLGQNRVTLENFTLGQRVEAPNILDVPLDLAVALLKDDQGRIDLAVPVEGTVDNPRFDYGRVVGAAVRRVLARVVTAPFRFLARLVGRERPEELARVEFAPGSDRLARPEREDLLDVVAALKQRPQLKLVVGGPFDPRRDGQALRAERVARALAAALGRELAPDEPPGPFDFADPRTQQALERLAAEHAPLRGWTGPGAPPRRSAEGEAAHYRALFDRVAERYPLPDEALRRLAARRVAAIVGFVVGEGGIAPERVAAGGTGAVRETGETIPAGLEVDVADDQRSGDR